MRSYLALFAVFASACTQTVAPGAAPSGSTAPEAVGAPSGAASTSAAKAPVFDVHEWGLVDVSGPNGRVLAGPPNGPTNWNAPRRKPVLYFHLADGTPSVDATVKVRAAAPGIVEHFPAGTLSDDRTTLEWRGVHVEGPSCPVGAIPTRDAPECKTSDGLCEALELKRYQTADASCAHLGGGAFNHLFYRTLGPAPALPFDVVPKGTSLAIAHARANDFAGPIIWVHNDNGAVTLSVLDAPKLGAQLEATAPKDTDVAPAQTALDASMRASGLTDEEIQAFDRAWSNDLFGRTAREAPSRRASAPPSDYLLFALPSSLMAGASEVTITPAPRALKRFMLVRMAV